MKTLLPFSRSPFFRTLIASILITNAALAGTVASSPVPGVIESLRSLSKADRTAFEVVMGKATDPVKFQSELADATEITLDPDFMSSVLFHSDVKFIFLASMDPCALYSSLEWRLLSDAEGIVENVAVRYRNPQGLSSLTVVPVQVFLDKIYRLKCRENLPLRRKFLPDSIGETLAVMKFPVPPEGGTCEKIIDSWISNPNTLHLCSVVEKIEVGITRQDQLKLLAPTDSLKRRIYQDQIREGNEYADSVPKATQDYIRSMCRGLVDKDSFCENFFTKNVWDQILKKQRPIQPLFYRCQSILNKDKPTREDLKACAARMTAAPSLCSYLGTSLYPSLTPKPSCEDLSMALNLSRLFTDYEDCPGKVANEGVVNINRLIHHLEKKSFLSNSTTCHSDPAANFAGFALEQTRPDAWAQKICFTDPVMETNVCLPTIMSEHPTSDLSADKVITQVMRRTKGLGADELCRLVPRKNFNPVLLAFKRRCFALYDEDTCTAMWCPKEVMWQDKSQLRLRTDGMPAFDYFPASPNQKNLSFSALLEKKYKFHSSPVKNLTELELYLSQNANNILHGIGCAEDILPSFFPREALNQCTPMPFIIDGLLKRDNTTYLSIRTAFDDVQTPRMINWGYIYTAVKAWSDLHPSGQWGLYVVR